MTILVCFISLLAIQGFAQTYEVEIIDVPGYPGIYLGNMNPRGEVAGFVCCPYQGFIWDGKQFVFFNVPGAEYTQADGVNEKGEATGTYLEAGSGLKPGFVRTRDGNFFSFSVAGSRYTGINTINPAGWMAGCFEEAGCVGDNCLHGFLLKDDTFFQLDVPEGVQTDAFDINARGDVVGVYRAPEAPNDIQHGFLFRSGTYHTIQYPGATWTHVGGISNCGEVVGSGSNEDEGWVEYFIFKVGVFKQISMPMEHKWIVWLSDINCRGEISGSYWDMDGARHGFILRPVHQE